MRSKIRHKVRDYSKQIPGFRTTDCRTVLSRPFSKEEYINFHIEYSSVKDMRTGCILHQGGLSTDGYARGYFNSIPSPLSRIVLETKLKRDLRPGMETLHRSKDGCYRNCINPDHLFEGSHKENMDERRRTIIRRSTDPRFHRRETKCG